MRTIRNLIRSLIAFAIIVFPVQILAAPNPQISALVDGVDNGEEGPQLIIDRVKIDIRQHGTTAEFDLYIEVLNPSDDEVEGRFTMQLPRDAVLTGYALDIEENMIPGSLIDQPKARQIYEDEVRGSIDPGLAEISTGNVFATRIYPITAEGRRAISLKFVTPIDPAAPFTLPFETASVVGRLTLNAEFSGLKQAPQLMLGNQGPLVLARKGRSWAVNDMTVSGEKLQGALTIQSTVPRSKAQATLHETGKQFFAIDDTVEAKALSADDVERIRIYWDRSRSRADAMLDAERKLIGQVLTELTPENTDIVRFASDVPDEAIFAMTNETADTMAAKVDAHLAGTVYRGATSLNGLDERDLVEADLCLLLSDGGATIDQQADFAPDCPLVIIASGPNIDASRLNRIARTSNAAVLYLTADNAREIAQQMTQLPLSVISVRDINGRKVKFRNIPASPGRLKVVGEMPEWSELTVRLSGVARGDRKQVYQVDGGDTVRLNAAGALWAQQEVASLSDDPADREKMRDMAQRFSVASPTMAFLVLESPEQYLNAQLTPPDAFSEKWMAQYEEARLELEDEKREVREEHFADVLAQWNKTKEWWARDFDGDAIVKRFEEDTNRPPPPPPPPPMSSPPSPPAAEGALEEMAEASGETADAVAADSGYSVSPEDNANEENLITVTASRRTEGLLESASAVTAISAEGLIGKEVGITLEDVLSDQPYLAALDAAAEGQRLAILAQQEKTFGALPAFYLDVSEWFRLRGETALARQLLMSALDLPTSDDETRLIAAFRLQRDGEHDAAIALYEALAVTTDYRPQPKRALALALAARAKTLSGKDRRDDLERAFVLLSKAVLEPFDGRYSGLDVIGLMELNSLIPLIDEAGGIWALDERLVALLDIDIRIIIEWTNADADLDLWVTEPTGERASYKTKRTAIGGNMSDDMTSGYGPEEYTLRRAVDGAYVVKVQGYSGDRINPNGPGRVMVRLQRAFTRPEQSEQLIDAEIGFDRSNENANDRTVATLSVE